jgi:hypothetical protein
MTLGRRSVIQSLPENDCRYPEGYHAFSPPECLQRGVCRREKCCVQLFECWLSISETGSEVCIYHHHSIATYARSARALYSAARHGS